MKYCILSVVCCVFSFAPAIVLAADSPDEGYPEGHLSEDTYIALLLQTSECTCAQLKALQANLAAFRIQETTCIQSPSNAEALYTLSECAFKLLTSIHETHVEPYFRSAFLEELERISKTAKNRAIPPICP